MILKWFFVLQNFIRLDMSIVASLTRRIMLCGRGQLMVAFPLIICYETGIIAASIVAKRRQ